MSEYVTIEPIKITGRLSRSQTLPVGSFVCPIDTYYLPEHIRNMTPLELWDRFTISTSDKYRWCYTCFGMMPILSKFIRRIK